MWRAEGRRLTMNGQRQKICQRTRTGHSKSNAEKGVDNLVWEAASVRKSTKGDRGGSKKQNTKRKKKKIRKKKEKTKKKQPEWGLKTPLSRPLCSSGDSKNTLSNARGLLNKPRFEGSKDTVRCGGEKMVEKKLEHRTGRRNHLTQGKGLLWKPASPDL